MRLIGIGFRLSNNYYHNFHLLNRPLEQPLCASRKYVLTTVPYEIATISRSSADSSAKLTPSRTCRHPQPQRLQQTIHATSPSILPSTARLSSHHSEGLSFFPETLTVNNASPPPHPSRPPHKYPSRSHAGDGAEAIVYRSTIPRSPIFLSPSLLFIANPIVGRLPRLALRAPERLAVRHSAGGEVQKGGVGGGLGLWVLWEFGTRGCGVCF